MSQAPPDISVRVVEDTEWWEYGLQAAPAVGPLIVLIGLAFAWYQLRDARRTRYGQLVMEIGNYSLDEPKC